MNAKTDKPGGAAAARRPTRDEKLAEALRANLRRRKSQARERNQAVNDAEPHKGDGTIVTGRD